MPIVAIPFLAFAAAFVLAGLSQTFNAQHGQSEGGFAGFLNSVLNNALVAKLTGATNQATRYIISRFAGARFRELTSYLHSIARLWKGMFRAMRAHADATTGVAEALERAIPVEARKAAAPGLRLGHLNARQLGKFRAEVKPAIKRLTVAVDVTIPQQLGRIRARERTVERDQAKLRERTGLIENGAIKVWDWLRAHPYSVAVGAFAGAIAIALPRIGLGGLNCRNFKNLLGKFGCGLGTLLNDLLGLVVAGIALEGVCEFLPEVEAAFGAIAGPMVHILNEVPLGACETVPDGWSALTVRRGPLPPSQTLGQLAA